MTEVSFVGQVTQKLGEIKDTAVEYAQWGARTVSTGVKDGIEFAKPHVTHAWEQAQIGLKAAFEKVSEHLDTDFKRGFALIGAAILGSQFTDKFAKDSICQRLYKATMFIAAFAGVCLMAKNKVC